MDPLSINKTRQEIIALIDICSGLSKKIDEVGVNNCLMRDTLALALFQISRQVSNISKELELAKEMYL